ncbi:beta-1,4-galactosyltransferase 4-like [Dermacentor albipictus]|uniref:beta-1,4-galactosyltransferase 4-like n=1 Tax=Dermacentor albipictus TaxID=60249 RepID=UPI0038FCD463
MALLHRVQRGACGVLLLSRRRELIHFYKFNQGGLLIGLFLVALWLSALRCPTWLSGDHVVFSEADIERNPSECPWTPREGYQLSWQNVDLRIKCPLRPSMIPAGTIVVQRSVNRTLLKELETKWGLLPGGRWSPPFCNSRHFVAVVVPYRDRSEHLDLFLQHMHLFLQRQQLQYGMFVVEQSERHAFNRAKLFNIGFTEALARDSYCCFVFHDVDLLPIDARNLYRCERFPRHLSSAIDVFRFVLPYPDLFGGAVAVRADQFHELNGFSNEFFGWGGEDDDLQRRIRARGLTVIRWPTSVSRYTMLAHTKAKPSLQRQELLRSAESRYEVDGLNNLRYQVLALEEKPLYTRILVDVDPPVQPEGKSIPGLVDMQRMKGKHTATDFGIV